MRPFVRWLCGRPSVILETVGRRGIVYIASDANGGFSAHWDAHNPPAVLEEGPGWCDVEQAIAWGRERSTRVLVRLGATDDTSYSAGDEPLTRMADGSGGW